MNKESQEYAAIFVPIVFINGNMFRGNINDIDTLMETFCNSFSDIPKYCKV